MPDPANMMARPWCCPEPHGCRFIAQLRDYESRPLDVPQPGQSWICFGVVVRATPFSYDGVEHPGNDLRSCHYSALKGLIRWQENRGDWENTMNAYRTALRRLDAIGEGPHA